MKDKEPAALKVVLVYEGLGVDHPKDPGGRTMKGVTQRVYDAYRSRRKLPTQDVFKISDAEVAAIYDTQYWDKVKGDDLPAGIDLVVFDGAVHSGPSQSVKWVQRALGSRYSGSVDGVMGEATLNAIRETNDHDQLIADIIARRRMFLKALKTYATFGKGWESRLRQVQQTGQAWATGSTGPAPVFVADANVKASIEDAKNAPTKGPADAATGVGGSTATAAATLQAAKDQLEPYTTASQYVVYIVVGLTVAGIALMAGGLAYRSYAKRQNAKIADALNLAGATP